MKRITPKQRYQGDEYPTAEESGVTRRGMLSIMLKGAAATGAAAVGMGVLLDDADARRGRLRGRVARPRYRAFIDLKPDFRIKGHKSWITGLMVYSYERALADYFKGKKRQKAAGRVIRKALGKFSYADLANAKKRYKVQRAVSKALQDHYKKRTKRHLRFTYVQLTYKTPTS